MDKNRLAARTGLIEISPMMKGRGEAERLRRQGISIIDLGVGEPDFPTPHHIKAAAHLALDRNWTKYTPNPGILEVREAVAARYFNDYGVTYHPDEVLITAGGKQALFHAAFALFEPGDEVITHVPGWPTLVEQIKLAGATPIRVRAHPDHAFALTAEMFLSAITPRTRGIVINSPGNPTGALISEREAQILAETVARLGIWIVLDLCYERLIYDNVAHNLPRIFGDLMRDRLVLAGSTSKSYAMPGFRCGWMVAPKFVTNAASALQSHTTSHVTSITQRAAIAALHDSQQCVDDMLAEYRRRRDLVLDWLSKEPRLRCAIPQGGFYLFPSIADFISPDRCGASLDFAEALLRDEGVIVTAGEVFDAPGFLRLSYATSLDLLQEGTTRLLRFAQSLAV